MTQVERLLDHLKTGSTITPLESWENLGIYRLADCVYQLRKKGYEIINLGKKVNNRFGESCTVGCYKLSDV